MANIPNLPGVPALMTIAAACRGPEVSVRSRWGFAETSVAMGRRLVGRLHGLWLGGVPEMLHQTGETCRWGGMIHQTGEASRWGT
jgi:hypothetical protein